MGTPTVTVGNLLGQLTDVAPDCEVEIERYGSRPLPVIVVDVDTNEPTASERITLTR